MSLTSYGVSVVLGRVGVHHSHYPDAPLGQRAALRCAVSPAALDHRTRPHQQVLIVSIIV
jgi:hypothetical protein